MMDSTGLELDSLRQSLAEAEAHGEKIQQELTAAQGQLVQTIVEKEMLLVDLGEMRSAAQGLYSAAANALVHLDSLAETATSGADKARMEHASKVAREAMLKAKPVLGNLKKEGDEQ